MPTPPDKVQITKTFRDDHWVVHAEVIPVDGGVLPAAVFIYENDGSSTLGVYWGVCSIEELQRLKVWTGEVIRKFGNRYVRHNVAELHLTPGTLPDGTINLIRRGLSSLRNELISGAESSTVYAIP